VPAFVVPEPPVDGALGVPATVSEIRSVACETVSEIGSVACETVPEIGPVGGGIEPSSATTGVARAAAAASSTTNKKPSVLRIAGCMMFAAPGLPYLGSLTPYPPAGLHERLQPDNPRMQRDPTAGPQGLRLVLP
jgi:hypothetical protein